VIEQAIGKIVAGRNLERAEMAGVIDEIMAGGPAPAQIGALLIGLRMKGETVDEIAGAAETVRARVEPARVRHPVFVDTCGTGGDGRNTFNISTAAAFVVAAAGVPVAKHGNRSISSRCGSADVLTALGVDIMADTAHVERCIDELGIGFLFAPRHHPSFKAVGEIRRQLGVRTLFNLLGPLANPAGARHQVMGVYEQRWVPIIGRVLQALGAEHAFVVHGDGLDEIAVSGPTVVCELSGGTVRDYTVTPEEIGVSAWPLEALAGGDATTNASILRQALAGQTGAPREAVLANASAALVAGGAAATLRDGVGLAKQAIDSGAALAKLDALVSRTPSQTPTTPTTPRDP
jgi:anthranilate phosphoribosyltransferase